MTVCKLDAVWSLLAAEQPWPAAARPVGHGKPIGPAVATRLESSREEIAWKHWADAHLGSGDLVFVRGESRILFGLVNFSQLCTDVADSRFSHVGLVSREQDGVFVYDVVVGGPRHVPFGKFATDKQISLFAVKRLKPDYRGYVPAAIEYCRQVAPATASSIPN